jgi:hypothetical protein
LGAALRPAARADSRTGVTGTPRAFTRTDGAGVFQTNCLVLLKLKGGCAYDLSLEDTALEANTRVSDVCPNECSGHGQCVASVVDIAFLGLTDDSSGFGGIVALHGGACVDGGGVTFDGESWTTITPGEAYGNGAELTLTFWVLLAAEDVWTPHSTENYARALYVHPPRSSSSIAGGISVSLSRGVWLDAWTMHTWIAGTDADYALSLLRDATPKWTHIGIVVKPAEIRVYEDAELIHGIQARDAAARRYVGTMDLGSEVFLGGTTATYGWSPMAHAFRGSVAMLQLYALALGADDLQCVFEGGKDLVQNQRMAQDTPSACGGRVTTGCTNPIADNYDDTVPLSSIDDGSCRFGGHEATLGEHGIVHVTDEWQRVDLTSSYTNPVVLCGVVTRESTTQAVVRVRSVATDPHSGAWYFEIAAEQKSCHFAQPPPTSEHVDYIVVDGGVSTEGWQAGIVRVHDAAWHRTSFLREFEAGTVPVVISQAQTYDNRTQFVSTRHYFPSAPTPTPELIPVFLGCGLQVPVPNGRELSKGYRYCWDGDNRATVPEFWLPAPFPPCAPLNTCLEGADKHLDSNCCAFCGGASCTDGYVAFQIRGIGSHFHGFYPSCDDDDAHDKYCGNTCCVPIDAITHHNS